MVLLALAFGLTNWSEARAAPVTPGPAPSETTDTNDGDRAQTSDVGDTGPDTDTANESERTPDSGGAAPTGLAPAAKGTASEPADEGDADDSGEGDDEAPDSALHGLACLEGDATGGRRKGVQRRDFLKRHRFELAGLGGYYASDALSSTYVYGGALAYYPSEDFGLEVLVTRSPIRFRLEEPFSAFDLEHHFQDAIAWQGILSLLWSPIHAKFKFADATIIHGDIFAVAGAGRTFNESVLGLTWEAGGGLKLYLSRYFTFRLDVRDFLLPQEVLGRGRITNNITVLGGFSLWLG